MAYETLEETRKWLEEQEEKVGITYSDKISHMTLSNSGSRPNYEVMAKMLSTRFPHARAFVS